MGARFALVALLFGASACSVDLPVEGDPGYACFEGKDCLDGYLCVGAAGDLPGRCVSESAGGPDDCFDRDGDGAFVGTTCRPDQLIDCDDTNPLRGPTNTEICDGIDNDCDCPGDTNGDGVVCGPGDEGVDEDLPLRPCAFQLGVCAGAVVACENGAYADCATAGLYGDDYETVETSCDGLDNNCNGEVDEGCDCAPGSPAQECGTDTGTCTRGLKVCEDNGRFSDCVAAPVGRVCSNGVACTSDADCADGRPCALEVCTSDSDCNEGGLCVAERLDDSEDLFDDCERGSAVNCNRSVCRYLPSGDSCTTSDTCTGGACVDGACRPAVVGPTTESCNGLDDDCDGVLDNDARRLQICGPCPYNSAFVSVLPQSGGTVPSFLCVDWYEASRPDATATSAGTNELYTLPRAGVIPWTGITPEDADGLCRGAPLRAVAGPGQTPIATRRLCKSFEWKQACGGTTGTVAERRYPYSDRGGPTDVFVSGACVDGTTPRTGPEITGVTDTCCVPVGAGEDVLCDMVGNVAEYIVAADIVAVAGGSYRDTDETVLSCGDGVRYQPVPADVLERDDIGFRCCTERAR